MDAGKGVRSGAADRLRLSERTEQGCCASNKLAAGEGCLFVAKICRIMAGERNYIGLHGCTTGERVNRYKGIS